MSKSGTRSRVIKRIDPRFLPVETSLWLAVTFVSLQSGHAPTWAYWGLVAYALIDLVWHWLDIKAGRLVYLPPSQLTGN